MTKSSIAIPLRAFMVAAMLAASASPAFSANYTWKTLSGTGNWTDSVNWSGTSATNLYPGSVGSGTADAAFIQANYTSAPTINLNTSVTIRQLNLGGTTGATTFPVTLSTSNASAITLAQTTGTSILAVNSAVNSGTNVLATDILVNAATLETRMASVTTGTVNLAITGNVSAGSSGNKILRYTPNNTSTTTSPSILDYRGNITNGTSGGTVSMFYRMDMPNSVNTLRLSGTGNTFSGGINFSGGKTNQSILEASPASGTNGALGTGLVTIGVSSSGSSAILNLGGSPATVTETAMITIAGTVVGSGSARKIANIGTGHRILSGTVGVQAVGVTLACESSGNLTFTNTIQNSGPIKINSAGSGKVVFAGATSTFSGPTTIEAGVLQLGAGSSAGTSTITPLAGGTLSLSPYAVTTVAGLLPNAGGLTDVGNGSMTVSSGLSAVDMVTALVTGRGDGSWNGASGITSSTAAASGGDRTVGWLDNGDGSVTFAFAAAGDTNLDWQVDILDASNFLAGGKFDSGSPASWNEGDFTYDGFVDILDAASFLSNGLFDAGAYNSAPGQAGAVAAVPEPAGLGAAVVALAAAMAMRRRCSSRG
jgi:autotransporter-associated beta strand protein